MQTALKATDVPYGITKANSNASAFVVTGRAAIAIAAGVSFLSADLPIVFQTETPIAFDAGTAAPGTDYRVVVYPDGKAVALPANADADEAGVIGGFHYAPGGCAAGTNGGDDVPAINPYSCWDLDWRPACGSPAGMALVDGKFWCDIYLSNPGEVGSSQFGLVIADGDDRPAGMDVFDFEAAKRHLSSFGKQLLGAEEFFAMAYGVTERSAAGSDPKIAGLDAPRTSRWGIMQATGNTWAWGTDGHPDIPRPSFFGGSWLDGSYAGSRYASLGYWPEHSDWRVGARGRSDHLNLA